MVFNEFPQKQVATISNKNIAKLIIYPRDINKNDSRKPSKKKTREETALENMELDMQGEQWYLKGV